MSKAFDPTPDSDTVATTVEAPAPAARPPKSIKQLIAKLDLDLVPNAFTPGYAQKTFNVDLDTAPQAIACKLLTLSLIAKRAELDDGTRVQRPEHTVQWLFEQIASLVSVDVFDELSNRVNNG